MDHNKHKKALNISSQLLRSSRLSYIGIASCMGLTGLIVTTLLCPVSSRVSAAEAIPASENVVALDNAAISIAIDDTMVAVNLNPNENNGFASGSTKVRVTTDNASGYKLSMNTEDGTSNLNRTDTLSDHIGPVEGNVGSGNFAENTWGYNLAEGEASGSDFQAVPGSSTNVAETDTAEQGTWTLTFGAKVSKTLPAGEYKNKVIISAVANPPVLTGLNRIDTMQAMTHEICEQANVHDSKQLVDVRDGQSYWVTKLADGNCWMTQNLALTFGTGAGQVSELTSETSDLGYDTTTGSYPATPVKWTQSTSTSTSAGKNYPLSVTTMGIPSIMDTSNTGTRSWNLSQGYGQNLYEQMPHDGNKNCGSVNNISKCVGAGKTLSADWSDTGLGYEAAAAHYLIGNYYQSNVATAGTGGAITTGKTPDSICPRNWRLATTGRPNKDKDSFYYLLQQYGLQSLLTGIGLDSNSATAGKSYNIATDPLFFVRGGEISAPSNPPTLHLTGLYGYYWDSNMSNEMYSDGLFFHNSSVSPLSSFGRYFGASVRCLSR